MKTIIKPIAVLMAMTLFAGCEAFLDTESFTDRNTGNFPSSETDALQLMTGVYNTLNSGVYEPGSSYWMTAMLASDECYGGGGQDDYDTQASDHLLVSDENIHGDYWNYYYSGIARANMAIANLDKVEDEALRNQLLGEAYFLRSFFLFDLTQLCGEIPLVSGVPGSVAEAAQYPEQASIEEIYGTIAAGLKQAIEIMPSNRWDACISGLRHATKWDAEALLARVFLFYTGFYSDKNGTTITDLPLVDLETGEMLSETVKKEYVIEKLNDCIQNSGHELVSDYRLMWSYTNSATKKDYAYAQQVEGTWITDDKNPEAMFQICVTNLAESSRFCNKYNQYLGVRKRSNWETNAFPFGRGYGWATVNPYVWTKWAEEEPGDIRREASIWSLEEEGNEDYTWGNDQQMEETGFWQKKYQTWGAIVDGTFYYEFSSVPEYGGTGTDLGRGHSPQNIQLIRFADVLLMHSELTQTADGMNRVRARVGLEPKAYSWEAIEMERRHELAFEAIRWTDMRRYGKAYAKKALATQLGGEIRNANGAPQLMKDQGPGYEARYEATYGFRPFPQSEISLSNGVLKQNAGWTGADSKYAGWK